MQLQEQGMGLGKAVGVGSAGPGGPGVNYLGAPAYLIVVGHVGLGAAGGAAPGRPADLTKGDLTLCS